MNQNTLQDPGYTRIANHHSRTEKQEVDRLLFALNVPADFIHDVNQADVCLDEYVLPFRVQRLAFGYNAISGFLRAANKTDAGSAGMLRELFQRRLADAVGGTDEDGNETRRKREGDTGVRGLSIREGDHCVVLTEE